jgi:hypothetical protein
MSSRRKAGGFSYTYDEKTLKAYLALSLKDRLEWLEEANAFLYKFTPPKNREIWQKFRRGEI